MLESLWNFFDPHSEQDGRCFIHGKTLLSLSQEHERKAIGKQKYINFSSQYDHIHSQVAFKHIAIGDGTFLLSIKQLSLSESEASPSDMPHT